MLRNAFPSVCKHVIYQTSRSDVQAPFFRKNFGFRFRIPRVILCIFFLFSFRDNRDKPQWTVDKMDKCTETTVFIVLKNWSIDRIIDWADSCQFVVKYNRNNRVGLVETLADERRCSAQFSSVENNFRTDKYSMFGSPVATQIVCSPQIIFYDYCEFVETRQCTRYNRDFYIESWALRARGFLLTRWWLQRRSVY